jgi:hypothetical protein
VVLRGSATRLEDGHTWRQRRRSSRLQLVAGGAVARSVDGGKRVHGAEWSRREGMRREMVFGFALRHEAIRMALEAHVVDARGRGRKGCVVENHGQQWLEPGRDESRWWCDRCQDGLVGWNCCSGPGLVDIQLTN